VCSQLTQLPLNDATMPASLSLYLDAIACLDAPESSNRAARQRRGYTQVGEKDAVEKGVERSFSGKHRKPRRAARSRWQLSPNRERQAANRASLAWSFPLALLHSIMNVGNPDMPER